MCSRCGSSSGDRLATWVFVAIAGFTVVLAAVIAFLPALNLLFLFLRFLFLCYRMIAEIPSLLLRYIYITAFSPFLHLL